MIRVCLCPGSNMSETPPSKKQRRSNATAVLPKHRSLASGSAARKDKDIDGSDNSGDGGKTQQENEQGRDGTGGCCAPCEKPQKPRPIVAVAIGDLHFDVAYADDCRRLAQELVNVVTDCSARYNNSKPYVVVLGDTLHHHEKVFTESMTDAVQLFKNLRDLARHLYIIVGNHDLPSGHDYLRQRHWLHAIKGEWSGTTVIDRPTVVMWENRKIVLAPYVPAGMFQMSLKDSDVDATDASAVFCHQEFSGARFGPAISSEGDSWPASGAFVVSGHVHLNQMVGDNVYYVGSSMQLAFGDSSKTVVGELCFPDRTGEDAGPQTPIVREVELTSIRKKRSINLTSVQAAETESGTSAALAHARAGDCVRVSVAGTPEEFRHFVKTDAYRDLARAGAVVTLRRPRESGQQHLQRGKAAGDSEQGRGRGGETGDCGDTLTRSFFLAELQNIVSECGDPRVHSMQREVFSKLGILL